MKFLNKKGVEALPLRYIIIALVAALVVGIVLQMTGTLQGGIESTTNTLVEKTQERTVCELDNEEPVISDWTGTCNATTNEVTITTVEVTDECGIEWVQVELHDGSNFQGLAKMIVKSESSNTWKTDGAIDFNDAAQVTETYNIDDGDKVVIWVKDKAPAENYGTEITNIVCEI